jgi:hypothetical protein
MLPHYSEGTVQFGLLHADLTPRPGYLALAAVGRLLADAKPLGRMEVGTKAGQAYFFSARPDGKAADVAVVWARNNATLELPVAPQACYDHLGRVVPVSGKVLKVGRAPLFAVLRNGAHPALIPPPQTAKLREGKSAPVVLQALLPEADLELDKSAYKFGAERTKVVPVFLYYFGQKSAAGRLAVRVPEEWSANCLQDVEIAPGDRKELALTVTRLGTNSWREAGVRIVGDFGSEGRPVLALRFVPK